MRTAVKNEALLHQQQRESVVAGPSEKATVETLPEGLSAAGMLMALPQALLDLPAVAVLSEISMNQEMTRLQEAFDEGVGQAEPKH